MQDLPWLGRAGLAWVGRHWAGLGWARLGRIELSWSGLGWAGLTLATVAVSKTVLHAPFSQLTLKRPAARQFPLPAPTERHLAADGHEFSLTVGSA